MQKVDPPAQVIDAFRDVQAARADLERAQNEAQTYANRVIPEARGRAAQIMQNAEAYREQTVAEAKGQTSRFLKIYDEYKKAPDVTRQRIYLETMEKLFGGTDKIILDSGGSGGQGVVPYLPLNELTTPRQPRDGRQPMRLGIAGGILVVLLVALLFAAYSAASSVYQTQQALVVRLGKPVRVVERAGPAISRCRSSTSVIYIDKRILDLENPVAGSHRLRPEASSWSMPSRATASPIR